MKMFDIKKHIKMKSVKLIMLVLCAGLLTASCHNNNQTSTETTDSTTMSTPQPDGTTVNNNVTDTMATATGSSTANNNSGNSNNTSGNAGSNASGSNNGNSGNRSVTRVEQIHVPAQAGSERGARQVSTARTGNTNGIKSRIKADSTNDLENIGTDK